MSLHGTDAWLEVLGETREALAALSPASLEALAERASAMPAPPPADLRRIAAEHRVLGLLLEATAANLSVLERIRERAGSPWDR